MMKAANEKASQRRSGSAVEDLDVSHTAKLGKEAEEKIPGYWSLPCYSPDDGLGRTFDPTSKFEWIQTCALASQHTQYCCLLYEIR